MLEKPLHTKSFGIMTGNLCPYCIPIHLMLVCCSHSCAEIRAQSDITCWYTFSVSETDRPRLHVEGSLGIADWRVSRRYPRPRDICVVTSLCGVMCLLTSSDDLVNSKSLLMCSSTAMKLAVHDVGCSYCFGSLTCQRLCA